ncbi:flagellar assembly protein T N-terminal domain-containing protein [Glaciecola siphonariae]|uniref:Flagellar assembly protein T N-terminal domain-containing protein n=1 Tax=Glaciecola siphonariae TaxID=521012 RepID=A0ABV9LWX8_9ALTE
MTTLLTKRYCLLMLISLSVFVANAHAAWFAASGQAVIVNGDKEAARQQATEEAIRQALLFAGASVTSVQQITNGLLLNDHLEVRAAGEVAAVELTDEVYQDGVVTVSIRADIFAQNSQCSASDYTKRIASTYFPIRYEGQAANGQIQKLGKEVALKFQSIMDKMSSALQISHIEPYVFDWHLADVETSASVLTNKTNTQYVLTVSIDDVSVEKQRPSAFEFYKGDQQVRAFDFSVAIVNGATGEQLFSKTYRSRANWEFDRNERVDVGSKRFWQSQYGQNIVKQIQHSIAELEENTRCEPTMGRVLAVANNQLQINLGRSHKVQAGDKLTLFNVKEVSDPFGQSYQQFRLHPTSLIVKQVYNNTATAMSADNSYLGDVQPNDFVARQ